ncbi:MAG TPA: hypothetical protein VJ851_04620 [Jatrophihabitans sp.]|nr:hypothetical protein [Jatrophihabitans sp.]
MLLLPAEAVEVWVAAALVVAHHLNAEQLAALPAVQRALKVVGVLAGLLAALLASTTHRLYLLPQFRTDDRLVPARVPDVFVADLAEVVAVLEDAFDLGDGQRPSREFRRRSGCDALAVEFVAQHIHRPVAGGVGLEQPAHRFGSVGIDFDSADFPAFWTAATDVDVAEGSLAWRAAGLDLLPHALT